MRLVGQFGMAGSPQIALPEPTKDEVALVDGRPFSISGFVALRSQLKNRSTEAVFWVGTAALILQNASRAHGHELDPTTAVALARYAMGELSALEADQSLKLYAEAFGLTPSHAPLDPQTLRKQVEILFSHSIVRRNNRALASLSSS